MTAQQEWQKFLGKLQKDKNPLYDLYKDSQLEIGTEITIYFSDEEAKKKASAKWQKLQAKFPPHWKNQKINFKVGQLAPSSITAMTRSTARTNNPTSRKLTSPLQALNHRLFNNNDTAKPVLIEAAAADKTCQSLYQQLTEKTKRLADETLTVEFIWRLRVGGMRGFQELLLPVFHPVYGVPYIPSSSLKGVVKAWARQHRPEAEVNRLLGTLEDGIGCVQFLDAFPTAPCLTVDIANPQWSWENNRVCYQPVPHYLLSMEEPEILIGLTRTSRGKLEDVSKVKDWLQIALSAGIGSRVSAGYGRTSVASSLSHHSSHAFKLWTQGIYGANPPTKDNQYQGNNEFRPVAVRGMLRYWFRAVGLSIYSPQQCKDLEGRLFGTIEPQAQEGLIRISVDWEEEKGDRNRPYFCEGNILLEAKNQDALNLAEKLLQLSSHLAGIGRGSRRSLHWNNSIGLRGCHWEIDIKKLPRNQELWQQFLREVKDSLLALQSAIGDTANCTPGNPGNRSQDVLNSQAQIYLISCPSLKYPGTVNNWQNEGLGLKVRGEGLDFLYSSGFKGVNQKGNGNANVGGRISRQGETASTPSYVLIKSNFPPQQKPYQTVTIFGVNQRDRATFIQQLNSLNPMQIQ
ncbi:MAG: RAMP superfamily CRISPR-associated protein [bacterium]